MDDRQNDTKVPDAGRVARQIMRDFDADRKRYLEFCNRLANELRLLVKDAKIPLVLVEGRVKKRSHLKEKLNRPEKAGKYKTLQDVTDVAGTRVVVYDPEHIEQVGNLIRSNFKVDDLNSVDKSVQLRPQEFGYLSVHYVISPGAERAAVGTFRDFVDLKAEIQVRTLLQHVWAAMEHEVGYKQDALPPALQRTMYQMAALLEVADKTFSAMMAHKRASVQEAQRDIKERPETVDLDAVSLTEYLKTDPVKALIARARTAGFSIGEERSQVYVAKVIQLCTRLEIPTIKVLSETIRATEPWIERYFHRLVGDEEGQGGLRVTPAFVVVLALAAAFAEVRVTVQTLESLDLPKNLAQDILEAAKEQKPKHHTYNI